ncbi:MAG TPA: spermidine/putrescine ABC transporter substrate-binding protein [Anaerolineae bacterium]
MRKLNITIWKALAALAIIALLATACGGGTTQAPTPSAGPTAESAEKKVTGSGFVCPEPDPKLEVTSTTLNLYGWTEYIPQDHVDCFEMVYGVRVNLELYSSNEEMYAKLSAGSASYDLVQPTDYIISLMIRQGLLQKLDKSKLPVLKNFDPNYLNLPFDPDNDYTIPYQAGTDAIVVNTDAIEDPPKSWADLWKPEFIDARRMVSLDDSRAVIGATLLTLGYDVNTTDPEQLEEARVKLTELAKGIKLYDSDSPKTALIAGDVDLGITWTGEAFLAHQENPAIEYVYPEEGAILWQDNYAMPASAPHPDAAYAWINYTMQGNLFWLMLRDFPYTNPDKAALDYAESDTTTQVDDGAGGTITPAELYAAYIESPITNTPPEAVKNGHRITDVGDALPLYDEIWTRIRE